MHLSPFNLRLLTASICYRKMGLHPAIDDLGHGLRIVMAPKPQLIDVETTGEIAKHLLRANRRSRRW